MILIIDYVDKIKHIFYLINFFLYYHFSTHIHRLHGFWGQETPIELLDICALERRGVWHGFLLPEDTSAWRRAETSPPQVQPKTQSFRLDWFAYLWSRYVTCMHNIVWWYKVFWIDPQWSKGLALCHSFSCRLIAQLLVYTITTTAREEINL